MKQLSINLDDLQRASWTKKQTITSTNQGQNWAHMTHTRMCHKKGQFGQVDYRYMEPFPKDPEQQVPPKIGPFWQKFWNKNGQKNSCKINM